MFDWDVQQFYSVRGQWQNVWFLRKSGEKRNCYSCTLLLSHIAIPWFSYPFVYQPMPHTLCTCQEPHFSGAWGDILFRERSHWWRRYSIACVQGFWLVLDPKHQYGQDYHRHWLAQRIAPWGRALRFACLVSSRYKRKISNPCQAWWRGWDRP